MNTNNATFSKNDLLVLFDRNMKFSPDESFYVSGVSTDTRTIAKGNLFIALEGENFDGNTMVVKAFELGAIAAVIDESYYNTNQEQLKEFNIITSRDTLISLGNIARYHRMRFEIPVIAVAGSNGKTTTKEMIGSILSKKYNLLKTEGNYNNRIGVPLTLLNLDESHELALLEIGTNEPGEIALLSSIVHPTAGIITNIGREHLEKLIDIDGVEMEETFLFGHLRKHNGSAFINNDDTRLNKYSRLLDRVVTYGIESDSDIKAQISFDDELKPTLQIQGKSAQFEVRLQAIGYAAGFNAIAAAAVGIEMNVQMEDIKSALENFEQETGHGYARMALESINNIKILNDCYNANPDSMRMALRTFEHFKTDKKKYLVLGDMREMGDSSQSEHILLLQYLDSKFEDILITGKEMLKAFRNSDFENIRAFQTIDELGNHLKSVLKPNDCILIKGSRGMQMEKVLEFL